MLSIQGTTTDYNNRRVTVHWNRQPQAPAGSPPKTGSAVGTLLLRALTLGIKSNVVRLKFVHHRSFGAVWGSREAMQINGVQELSLIKIKVPADRYIGR